MGRGSGRGGPRIEVRRAGERFLTIAEGMRTRHSFSFGEHYDPGNVGFAALMAHNEELLEVARGYDDHPHRDAEIVTWVLSGSLLHSDSAANSGIVHPGLAQRMSAGSGIVHAERNDAYRIDPDAPREPVRFVQTWLRPDESGTAPSYAQAEVSVAELATDWVPVVSGTQPDRAVAIGAAGATLWIATLSAGEQRLLPEGAQTHLYVARGTVELEQVGALGSGDAVRITGPAALRVTAREPAELMCWTFRS